MIQMSVPKAVRCFLVQKESVVTFWIILFYAGPNSYADGSESRSLQMVF